jgi:hypothetical protein
MPAVLSSPSSRIKSIVPLTTYKNSSPSGWTSPPWDPGLSMLGMAPIVYPSVRCGGPGGAVVIVIDQPRPMFATLPSKGTGDGLGTEFMRTGCPVGARDATTRATPNRAQLGRAHVASTIGAKRSMARFAVSCREPLKITTPPCSACSAAARAAGSASSSLRRRCLPSKLHEPKGRQRCASRSLEPIDGPTSGSFAAPRQHFASRTARLPRRTTDLAPAPKPIGRRNLVCSDRG